MKTFKLGVGEGAAPYFVKWSGAEAAKISDP